MTEPNVVPPHVAEAHAKKMMADPSSAEERVHQQYHALLVEARELESQALSHEHEALLLRAKARGLRTGAGGLEAALRVFQDETDKANAIIKERREENEESVPVVNYGDFPERKIRFRD